MTELLLTATIALVVVNNLLVSLAQGRLEKRIKALEESK